MPDFDELLPSQRGRTPMLVWDETDFAACLETLPVVGDHGATHGYSVARDGLRLEIVVWQYDGDVAIKLLRDGLTDPVFEVTLIDCAGARCVNDKAGERLEFAPAKAFGSRYDGLAPLPFGIAVSVKPGIQIRMFANDLWYNAPPHPGRTLARPSRSWAETQMLTSVRGWS